MNRKDESHEPVYTDEPLEMEITDDFLPPAEELRNAETKIILSSDAEKDEAKYPDGATISKPFLTPKEKFTERIA
jgi:hypothetical protein